MSERLEIRREGRLLHVALNRPEKRNALDVTFCKELASAFEEASRDPGTGAILLTANGKAFCAGMDLDEIREARGDAVDEAHERLFTAGARMEVPVVAAVEGPALAGGTGLAANCHIVVAAEDAVFGLTEIRIGLWPFLVFRAVAAAVGERRAVELALTGRTFAAAEAAQYGLVHHVTPAGGAGARAQEIAAALAQASAAAVRGGLAAVRESRGKSAAAAGAIARRFRREALESEEFREGLRRWRR